MTKRMNCHFSQKNGKKCSNQVIDGSNYCHLIEHYPIREVYDNLYHEKFSDFMNERIPCCHYRVKEVEGDGACLFRSLGNAIFEKYEKNLKKVANEFEKTGYFENDKFLREYFDIAECFEDEDYVLDDDIEEEIARGLQKLIVLFISKNSKMKIMLDMTIEELILLCHEINIETYIQNYSRFAGENDFLIEDTIGNDGHLKKEKIPINDRWGGIPELKVVCFLFNFNITIYTTQIFNKYLKSENTCKWNDLVYLKEIEKIESDKKNPINIYLLMRYQKKGPHYDYLCAL